MDLKDLDIVYFVKNTGINEELRYSLRSVDKNLPNNRVWIYGGCPQMLHPDKFVLIKQIGQTKWDKVQAMIREVAMNEEITENFILMNDDFFILKPIKKLPAYYRSSLYEHIVKIEMKHGNVPNAYTNELRKVCKALDEKGMTVRSYELHIPIVLNRHKILEVLGAFPGYHCTRTLYGNYCQLGGERRSDVKVFEPGQPFDRDGDFLSTEDETFATGEVGKFLKSTFREKSRFERKDSND